MKWIDRQDTLDQAMARVAAQPKVAVDTEADSLHSYFDKVCLIQISIPDEDLIIDPLVRVDLSRFGEILGNPAITKVFHGGDYDLRILHRDFNTHIQQGLRCKFRRWASPSRCSIYRGSCSCWQG